MTRQPIEKTDMSNPARDHADADSGGGRLVYSAGVCFVASVGGFLFGYDLNMIGSVNLYLGDHFGISRDSFAFGLVSASAVIGCIPGPLLGIWMCDALGRKRTMIFASLLLAVSAIVTALAWNIWSFNAFRIVGGLGVGLCSVASPMYIAEIAPCRWRGALGIMYQLAIVVGATCAPLAAVLIIPLSTPETCWRWMLVSETAAVLLFAAFLFTVPHSPRWLAGRGRLHDALAVLGRVNAPAQAEAELSAIQGALARESGAFAELFEPLVRRALFIGFALAFFNNWTGWSVIAVYIPLLFEKTGVEDRLVSILNFAVAYGAMGLMTVLSLLLVDRVGRRPLWMTASLAAAIMMGLAGAVFHFEWTGIVVLLVLILCTVPHGVALGGLPWLMISEIYPTRIRAKAVSITTVFLWVTIFSGQYLFPAIMSLSEKWFGSVAGAFGLFTLVCLASLAFGWKMLPETKGKVLENVAHGR